MSLIPDITETNSEGSITSKWNQRFFRGQSGKNEALRCSALSLPDSSLGDRKRNINLTKFYTEINKVQGT